MRKHIEDVAHNYDEIRQGEWRGGCQDYLFYRKGPDVVLAKPDGTFVTILRGGKSNPNFLKATPIG